MAGWSAHLARSAAAPAQFSAGTYVDGELEGAAESYDAEVRGWPRGDGAHVAQTGETLHATYRHGCMRGPARQVDGATGMCLIEGAFRDNTWHGVPVAAQVKPADGSAGVCTLRCRDGGALIGVMDSRGVLDSGRHHPSTCTAARHLHAFTMAVHTMLVNAAYVYPDGQHALVGEWRDNHMHCAAATAHFHRGAFLQHCQTYAGARSNVIRCRCRAPGRC